jgi:hypothetical protein
MQQPPEQLAPRSPDTADGDGLVRDAGDAMTDRLRAMPGLTRLVAEAEETWRARAVAAGEAVDGAKPGWRTFEDAFPTFYEFTNRPR